MSFYLHEKLGLVEMVPVDVLNCNNNIGPSIFMTNSALWKWFQ